MRLLHDEDDYNDDDDDDDDLSYYDATYMFCICDIALVNVQQT